MAESRPPSQTSRPSTQFVRPNSQIAVPNSPNAVRRGTVMLGANASKTVAIPVLVPSSSGAFPLHWQADEVVHFMFLMSRVLEKLIQSIRKMYLRVFSSWKVWMLSERARLGKIAERKRVVEVLKTSVRGSRTLLEMDILKRFIVQNLKCIPSQSMSSAELQRLCNEIDCSPTTGKSILFLQGDFGNCYYMIGSLNTIASYTI